MSAAHQDGAGVGALVLAMASGRAMLLLGQRHSPGLRDALRQDIAAITNQSPDDELVRLLGEIRDDSTLEGLRRAFEAHPVSPELIEVADNPWSYVVTSAIDSQVHEAFQRVGLASRQLRVLFAGKSGTLARSGAGTLTILRLFGALDERDQAYRPPASDLDLRRRQRLELPLVMNDLPRLIGPGGHLAVVGVGADDWIDLEVLALSCTDLPAGSIHWFSEPEQTVSRETLDALFGERLVFYERSLSVEVAATVGPERAALEHAREHVLHPASRQVTVRRGGKTEVITLSPAEWRRVSQVAVVLDDEAVRSPPVLAPDRERQAFRDFLYRVQRIPDWGGIARGFLFEREVAASLLERVEGELAALRSVHASEEDGRKDEAFRRRSSRLPVVVEGPPASGKSRLLHWLAFQLRRNGHVVVYVPLGQGRTSFEQVERVCRLLEGKTDSAIAVVADNLDEADYEQLGEVLASSGRRAVLVGAVNALRSRIQSELSDQTEDELAIPAAAASYTAFPLSSRLTDGEAERFLEFLAERDFGDIAFARDVVQQRLFLLLLYRLLPDSRGNIHLAVAQEYERLVKALERHIGDEDGASSELTGDWQSQLAEVRKQLFPKLDSADEQGWESPFRHDPDVIEAVQIALFCSLIERPLSLDLLLRTQSSRFLTGYKAFSRAIEETALLQETDLDLEGTVGIESEHPFVADVTLRSLLPDRAGQVRLLAPLIKSIRWEEAAYPGDNPDQDYAVSVFQAIGPRGPSSEKFAAPQALEEIIALLREVRVIHGARLPQLLLLEANALRFLANQAVATFDDSIARCNEAIDILLDAEQILIARRPSGSRNAQLQNVLTTRAVAHGFVCGACLREYRSVGDERRAQLREMLREHLDEVNRDTTRARSMGSASYFPLDVSFWAHRDQLEQLPDLSDQERVALLAKLESVLEVASEEPIEASQYNRYQRRFVDLAHLQGDVEQVESIARDLRVRGDFSADCVLARRKAIDPATRKFRSPELAREALADLLAFAPAILGSEEGVALLHHLWIGANLGGQTIGGVEPVYASCTREDWITLRRILEARLSLPANEANPYLNFCLAWSLLSLDEPVRALQILRANEDLAIGNRRRIGTLAVITDDRGAPVEYQGIIRRVEGQQAVLYVPRLLSEVRAPARVQAELAVAVHVGDEWRFGLGLNYRGVLPVSLPE